MFLQVLVSDELFDEMEQRWAPPDHPVFDITPPPFNVKALELYTALGSPSVTSDSFWDVYRNLLAAFHALPNADPTVEAAGRVISELSQVIDDDSGIGEMQELIYGFEDQQGPGGFFYDGGHPNPPVWFDEEIARRGIVPIGEEDREEDGEEEEKGVPMAFYARLTPPPDLE